MASCALLMKVSVSMDNISATSFAIVYTYIVLPGTLSLDNPASMASTGSRSRLALLASLPCTDETRQ